MFRLRFITILLVLLLVTGAGVLAQAPDSALVRFVHAIPGAATVDVYVDGQLTAANLDLGEASYYFNLPAAQQQITVTPVGATTALWEQSFTPGAGRAYTLVASSFDEPIAFVPFEDLLDPLPLGRARFTTIHAIADAPAVDVALDDGRSLVVQQAYNQPFGTLDIPVFSNAQYNLVVVPSGEDLENSLLTVDDAALNTGTSYMLLLYGTASNPQYTLLSAPTRPESSDSGFLRLVHAADAPAVDVYLGDESTLAATLFAPTEGGNATAYIALPAGEQAVELRASGTTDSLLSSSVTISSGEYVTAVVSGTAEDIALDVLSDEVSEAASDEALVRVINAGSEAASLSLADGTALASDLEPGQASEVSRVAPAASPLEAAEQDFYGGVLYDVILLDDVTTVAAASVNAGPGSAPGASAGVAVAAQPTLPPPTAEAPEEAPVAEPTTAPAAPTTPPQPTLAPVIVPTEAPPTGRVFNLNPDANLHLRQYPDANALSLGTVPFGTIFTVNGREGELEEIFISATQIPPDYEYVDPVSLLEDEDADLVPEETWLNVTYDTPDGGTIEAWVRADFIDVRDSSGEQIPLRDLDTVAGNRPGEARDTDITPPPVQEDVVTVRVINLDPTANLNVRRTPEVTSEVLAQLPLNTIAGFEGISEDGEWIFLSYAAPDGVVITGWSSAEYLELNLNGEPTDLETLEIEGLLTIADLTQRGSQTVGAAPVAVPTIDPTIDAIVAEVALDPGANLNLRRNPDTTAEVLAQIPTGTRLIVTERTDDAQWLLVTYEGVEGWVAAQTDTAIFVRLTFNGAPFDIEEVPVTVTAETTTEAG